jgi:hypothetical protein
VVGAGKPQHKANTDDPVFVRREVSGWIQQARRSLADMMNERRNIARAPQLRKRVSRLRKLTHSHKRNRTNAWGEIGALV